MVEKGASKEELAGVFIIGNRSLVTAAKLWTERFSMKLAFIVNQHAVGSVEEEGIRKLAAESVRLAGESLEGFDDTTDHVHGNKARDR